MKIVHVASELFPYIKTGGLADVAASLPRRRSRAEASSMEAILAPRTAADREAASNAESIKSGA